MRRLRVGLLSGLQFRMVLGFALVLTLSLVLVGFLVGVATKRQTEQFELDQNLARDVRVSDLVSEYYAGDAGWYVGDAGLQDAVDQAAVIFGNRLTVFDSEGNVVADSDESAGSDINGSTEGPALEDWGAVEQNDSESMIWEIWAGAGWGEKDYFPVLHDGEVVGSFASSTEYLPGLETWPSAPLEPEASRISGLVNWYLLWVGIGAAGLGTLLVWLFSRRMLAPLWSLSATARRLGQGNLSQRAEASGPSEFRQLANSFNAMAAELEDAEISRRNLTADIAHELRTPLSNIQGYLEGIQEGLIEPSAETIDTIHGQTVGLSRLVRDLHTLARVETGQLRLELAETDLTELLWSSVEAVRPRAEVEGVDLSLYSDPGLPIVALDEVRIAQAVGNLLENAITHTPEGGMVTVSACAVEGGIEVSIADTGTGIAPEDRARVFERFYRADSARSRRTGGSGLGLTIAQRLVGAHGGTIEAESVLGEGSRFTILIPVEE